ncbi:MAG TPA: SxtJ family membrane protein [Candidatus Binataceae bacterium]
MSNHSDVVPASADRAQVSAHGEHGNVHPAQGSAEPAPVHEDSEQVTADQPPVSAKDLRIFGLVLGAMFAVFFGLIPLLRHHATPRWPWILAGVLWLTALIWPAALSYLHRVWTRLGLALGWVNTRVILTLLFAIAIVPVGLVMRLMGRDRMARKLDPARPSYRVPSRRRPDQDMERPF